MALSPLPSPPDGVQYALTVPQSVLFADLSLRGSQAATFRRVFGTSFDLPWVAIDDGAMSWNYSDPDDLSRLTGSPDTIVALRRFVAAIGRTSRAVEKVASIVGPSAGRNPHDRGSILSDVREYWAAYENHMTSLFTFWNVEQAVSAHLTESLRNSGLDAEIANGLQRFLRPNESNYFAMERRQLTRLASRFSTASPDDEEYIEALNQHARTFGFLLTPFNLGAPASTASLHERIQEVIDEDQSAEQSLVDSNPDFLSDLPPRVQELGQLLQALTFWKTERLDVMSLGDARAADLYSEVAASIGLALSDVFSLTRNELDESLRTGQLLVSPDTIRERQGGFCLLLREGTISFFAPSRSLPGTSAEADASHFDGTRLKGVPASAGRASGSVRVVLEVADTARVEQGDILVTTMTRPEMGVALDRAAAFVTDQGGTMSHASIISREMRKPCVIGTEVATKVLRDGTRVTVDGDGGYVVVDGDNHATVESPPDA